MLVTAQGPKTPKNTKQIWNKQKYKQTNTAPTNKIDTAKKSPRASFGMENGATDAEKHEESKFTAKNAPKPQKTQKTQNNSNNPKHKINTQ